MTFEEFLRSEGYMPTRAQLAFVQDIDDYHMTLPKAVASGKTWILQRLDEYYTEHGSVPRDKFVYENEYNEPKD